MAQAHADASAFNAPCALAACVRVSLSRGPLHGSTSLLQAIVDAWLSLMALTHRGQAVCVLSSHGVGAGVGRGESGVMLAGGVADSMGGCYAVSRVLRPVPIA